MEIEEANNGDRENVDIEKASSSSSARAAKNKAAMYLAWQDLTVVLPNFGKGSTNRLLCGITGFAEPGRIMAIMGPSGSGKSTLLDSLSGRLSRNLVMTGNILLNGKKKRIDHGGLAYVTQENVLLGTLTVRETITFSARLRLPSSMSSEEINEIVEETIIDMGLHECADTVIGNWHLRGISGGEKKRLSIALEILTRPSLLFLDEPTSGLDSASAFFVVKILKSIAGDGRTVIASIHQPSSEVFALFDDLFLLSGGETVYFGEAKLAIQFFAETGYPCPSRRNPSDHFLRCVNSDFDIVTMTLATSNRIHETGSDPLKDMATAEIKALLIRKYRTSQYARIGKARIKEISSLEGLPVGTQKGSLANWQKQLLTLTQRSLINMSRDLGYYWFRILIYIVLSVCIGTVFFNVGTSYHAILARGACGGFLSGYMAMMSIGGFPSFVEEMKVFSKERLGGHYGVAVYTLSNFISSFPFLVIMSLASVTITYFMVKFQPGLSRFMYAFLDLLLSISTVESCMMIIASLVPNFLMGVAIGAGYIGIIMMTSGFFRMIPDLPKLFWRYPFSYLNYGAWGLEGAYKNDMLGLEFDASYPGGQKLKGEYILKNMLGVQIRYSKWWDLAAVLTILIAYRVGFFCILKFKERASPFFRAFYAKRTLHRLSKRPSFRKMPAFPSNRHQPLHPLSSQEGLQSPIK